MSVASDESFHMTEALLNGMISAINQTIPLEHSINKTSPIGDSILIDFGVFIGFTGDVKGKLLFSGDNSLFAYIGKALYGMELEGEMLVSFSGELGNMLAGGFSTSIESDKINIDITAPTIMEGHTAITGFKDGVKIPVEFPHSRHLAVFLLLD